MLLSLQNVECLSASSTPPLSRSRFLRTSDVIRLMLPSLAPWEYRSTLLDTRLEWPRRTEVQFAQP